MDSRQPGPSTSTFNATPTSQSGGEDAQGRIEREARTILRGFPVAAGLTGVADVVSHLPPLAPAPPSFFPASNSNSLQSIDLGTLPDEPLFDEYAREISLMLGGAPETGTGGSMADYWRQSELVRVAGGSELRQQLVAMQHSGTLPPLNPPFPFSTSLPQPSPSTSSSLSHRFLEQSGFPLAPLPVSFSNPSPGQNPIPPEDNYAFLDSFISEKVRRISPPTPPMSARSNGSSPIKLDRLPPLPPPNQPTPSARPQNQRRPVYSVYESSPDPLMMGYTASSPFHRPLAQPRRVLSNSNGVYASQHNGEGSVFSPSERPGLGESSPFPSPFALPNGSPQRRMVLGQNQSMSPYPAQLGQAFEEASGVDSAVKRIKLGGGNAGTPVLASGGSGRGKVIGGDTKNPVDRLSDLLSDIFSADDSHILDTSTSAVGSSTTNPLLRSPSRTANVNSVSFFRTTAVSPSDSAPLLSTSTLSKIQKLVQSISSRNKGEEMLQEVEDAGLARLLKLLARSWEGVTDQTYWDSDAVKPRDEDEQGPGTKGKAKGKGKGKGKSVSPSKKPGKKKKTATAESDEEVDETFAELQPEAGTRRRSSRSSSRSRSPTVQQEPDEDEASQNVAADTWTSDSVNAIHRYLRNLSDAILAIRTSLSILTLRGVSLPKHLFSSDYLDSVLRVLRHTLDSVFNPVLEAPTSSALAELVSPSFSETRDKISEVTDGLSSATDLLSVLVKQEDMSEDLVNSTVFFALDPFFHEAAVPLYGVGKRRTWTTAAAHGANGTMQHALKDMRLSCLSLVRRIYARYADQRHSIVEEVLGNLGRGDGAGAKKGKAAMRLRNNASIQTVSALLLHLVQTCAADLDYQVKKAFAENVKAVDAAAENGDIKMECEGPDGEEKESQGPGSVQRKLLDPAYESALKSARSIIDVLLDRSSKAGKAAAGTADSEYRKVLDNLIADLLSTLHLPEWPGAQMFLSVLCRYMIAALSDSKTSADSNALKAIALDHLGTITARIFDDLGREGERESLPSLQEIVSQVDAHGLDKLFSAQSTLLSHLKRLESSSPGTQGAADFTRVLFARELSRVRETLASNTGELDSQAMAQIDAVRERIDAFSRSTWTSEDAEDVFGPTPEDAQSRIDSISLGLSRSQPLANMYQPLISHIIEASESSQVSLRTKALRAIGLVVARDPSLFHQDNVRRSIENRMHDLSPAVRDTTIELVGKHIVNQPGLATQYLPQLIGRLSDAGLSVRRRVVKLLKILYGILEDEKHRIEICRHLVGRVLDEDDGVKELAVDALEGLWFGAASKDSKTSASSTDLSNVVLNVVGIHEGRVPPVEEALRLIMAKHAEKGTSAPLDRLKDVMENLIDSLVVDSKSMDVVACIKTVSILNAVDSSLLTTAKATLLVPFLKGASTPEEKTISDHLLVVFRGASLATPKTGSKFGKDLQIALLPMLNRPSSNLQTLQAVISCFSAVVWNQTQDFAMMVKIFSASMNRLLAEKAKLSNPARRSEVKLTQLSVVCYLVALLCEHGNYDRMRQENKALEPTLDKLTPDSIADFVFDTLVEMHNLDLPPEMKSALLTSLSFLWRAYPILITEPSSTSIIEAGFSSSDRGLHLQILRILQNFLASQEKPTTSAPPTKDKRKKVEEGVQMDELVGNVEGFADSGVASSVAQNYLGSIRLAAVSTQPQLQRVGIDIISMIARSGFNHPMSLAPTLVALTAAPDSQVASKANSTLTILHQKHASLLVTRFLDPAKESHAYVKSISAPSPPRGYRGDPPDSCFGRWFSLVHKEKRQVQLDYVKQLCRIFEVEAGTACTEDDVSLARFVAEALSTLDFKRAEEPMLVISRLNTILAVSGLQVMHLLEGEGGLLARDDMDGEEEEKADAADPATNEAPPSIDLLNQSIISGLALLLRDHLKQLYSINDAKMSKYVAGKKSAAGDKACTRRHGTPLALGADGYSRMPFALTPIVTDQDRYAQRLKYLALIREDGTITSLEEVDDDDDDA